MVITGRGDSRDESLMPSRGDSRDESLTNDRGVFLLPFSVLAVVVCFACFGAWALLRQWRNSVDIQLKLDRCSGEKALELKDLLGRLSSSNGRMKVARAAAAAAEIAPQALAALQAELQIEAAYQEGERLKWRAEGGIDLGDGICLGVSARPISYPALDWVRLPPDAIGPQPYRWRDSDPSFRVEFAGSSHRSAATVQNGGDDEADSTQSGWRARWAPSL